MPARPVEPPSATVVCPMRIEHDHVRRQLDLAGLGSVAVVQTGVGRDAVLSGVQRLAHDRTRLVILAGACGGLAPSAEVPAIARVIDEHGQSWTPFGAEPAGVTLLAVDRIISTPAQKRVLARRTGATIVDMESHAFAARCEQLGLAWSVVRGVSDTPDETLPKEVLGWITPGGDARTGRAVRDLLLHPALIPHIAAFWRRSSRVLPEVGRQTATLVRRWAAARASSQSETVR